MLFGHLPAVPLCCVMLAWHVYGTSRKFRSEYTCWTVEQPTWSRLVEPGQTPAWSHGWSLPALLVGNRCSWNRLFTGPFVVTMQLSLLRSGSDAVTTGATWFRATYRGPDYFLFITGAVELFPLSLEPPVNKTCAVPPAAPFMGDRKSRPEQLRTVGVQHGSDRQAEAFSAFSVLTGWKGRECSWFDYARGKRLPHLNEAAGGQGKSRSYTHVGFWRLHLTWAVWVGFTPDLLIACAWWGTQTNHFILNCE